MSLQAIWVLTVVLGLLVAAIAVQIARRPVVRRLAVRDALRRPSESALVIAGSLLGAAIISGSFIVGDTLESSIRANVFMQLGPVDEVIATTDASLARRVATAIRSLEDERIDGVTVLTSMRAPVAFEAEGERLAEPAAQVLEIDFADAERFGEGESGLAGTAPASGEAVVTETLAGALQAAEGDSIDVYLYGKRTTLVIDRVVDARGLAGFWLGFESRSPNVFVARGTIDAAAEAARSRDEIPPPTTYVLVSNRGDEISGAELSSEVTRAIEATIPADERLRVDQAKRDALRQADEGGQDFSELFVGIGSFAVLAGVLLLINIFVMLAEERKSQLGMLRAVGMKRSDLVRLFVVEGAFYSLVASAVGALLGIGVGWAIVAVAAPIFGSFEDFSLTLVLDAHPSSVYSGFLIGSLISLTTVLLTSSRISRINIIRAIRDLPEPPRPRVRRRAIVGGALVSIVGALLLARAIADDGAWFAAIVSVPLILFGVLPAAARLAPRRVVVLIASGGSLAWGIFGNAILDDAFFGAGEIFAFVMQGVLLTFSAVVLLSHSQEAFEGFVHRFAARNLPLRLGLAYPLARRFRTGLTLGMFALVMFTMVILSVMAAIFGGQVDLFVERAAGRYDIVATSSASIPPRAQDVEQIEGVSDAVSVMFVNALFEPPGYAVPEPWTASGVDAEFIEGGAPDLVDDRRAPGLDSDEEVWREVLEDPSAMVIPSFFLQAGGGPPQPVVEPGDSLLVADPVGGGVAERRVVGIVSEDPSFAGATMSKRSLTQIFGPRAVAGRFLIVADGSEAQARETATRLQGELLPFGVQAETFTSIVEDFGRVNLQFLRLMQGYLALGLVVGIAGLGVVMIRAVRDRRREIGVLRSLGLLAPQVRRAFMFESGFIALEGIAIGTILALVTASQLVATGSFGADLEFLVPWGQVAFLTSAAFTAALAATLWPARRAAAVPPAVALRVAD